MTKNILGKAIRSIHDMLLHAVGCVLYICKVSKFVRKIYLLKKRALEPGTIQPC